VAEPVIGNLRKTVVAEGNRYFPRVPSNRPSSNASSMQSLCSLEGVASYCDIDTGKASERAPTPTINEESQGER